MTTLAYDGKTIAVDSLLTCGGMISPWDGEGKLYHFDEGPYQAAAICGDVIPARAMVKYLCYDDWPDKPEITDEDDFAVYLMERDTNRVYRVTKHHEQRLDPIAGPYADGTGRELALGVMGTGADALTAVKVARKIDTCTNGPIQYYSSEEGYKKCR